MRLRSLAVTAAVAALSVGFSTAAARGADADRFEKNEFFVIGQYAFGDETTGEQDTIFEDIDVEYDDTWAAGLGLGTNITDAFNVNASVVAGPATLIVSDGFDEAEDDATLINPEFNVDWNIVDAPVTPFVQAGVGLVIFTGGDADETDLTYGAGAGMRFDLGDDAFLKVWYRAKWFELDDTEDALLVHTVNVGLGLMR